MSKVNYRVVHAIGDGNCAFNAFILGFCQKTTLDRVEQLFVNEHNPMSQFYRKAGAAIGVQQDALTDAQYLRAIKEKLLELREHDVARLQRALAPYMRQLACDLKYTEASKADFIPALRAAYSDVKAQKPSLGRPWSSFAGNAHTDDIFSRHPVILAKFKELREVSPELSEQEERDALAAWWNAEGFNLFVAGMRKPGAWAGDAELVALAQHFHVNLQIRTSLFTRQFHYEYGGLESTKLTNQLIDELVCRGVIEPPMNGHSVLRFILQPEMILRRLEAIPGVKEAIEALPEQGFKFTPVGTLPAASIDELKARGVVVERDKKLVFSTTKQATLIAVSPLSDDRAVIENIIGCIHDKSPMIVLENLGGHWNMLTKTNEHQLLKPKVSIEGNIAASSERWHKWRTEIEEKYTVPVQNDESESEKVAYTLDDTKIFYVTKDEQIAGDEALASMLQEEEYLRGRQHKR